MDVWADGLMDGWVDGGMDERVADGCDSSPQTSSVPIMTLSLTSSGLKISAP